MMNFKNVTHQRINPKHIAITLAMCFSVSASTAKEQSGSNRFEKILSKARQLKKQTGRHGGLERPIQFRSRA